MRLLIVSNRLPITVEQEQEHFSLNHSIGGLATGMKDFLDHFNVTHAAASLWLGWPGTDLKPGLRDLLTQELMQFKCQPIFIPETLMHQFYTGFCNRSLWPLFHNLLAYCSYHQEDWATYQRVNELFAAAIAAQIKPDDIIWIHDYHLLLLPKLLRQRQIHNPIGFFLHIPFPPFEVLQYLPQQGRIELLQGLLGSDLIGFHTHDYARNFSECVLRVLGYSQNMELLFTPERIVQVDVYPMSIDYKRIAAYARQARINIPQFYAHHGEHLKIILSLDRLDYTKGIVNRLQAYEAFLNAYPNWHGKAMLILIVAPSREQVAHYHQMKKKIDELVGRINGKFSTKTWTPILYFYQKFSFDELIPLFKQSDIAFLTPIRDGMNLIAKEFVAAKVDRPGVLILSETAGASKELLDALIVNPNCLEEMVAALLAALEMPVIEQEVRMQAMQKRIQRYDIFKWGTEFIDALKAAKLRQEPYCANLLTPSKLQELVFAFQAASSRLLLLDYDGTLVPFSANPKTAVPSAKLMSLLHTLASHPKNQLVIVSGRDKAALSEWFSSLKAGLVAEHGAWIKKHGTWEITQSLHTEWKTPILAFLEKFMDRLPGSTIEEKEFSVVWHYRNADPDKAEQLRNELYDLLVSFAATTDIQVLHGHKMIEVRCAGLGKDIAISAFQDQVPPDFILALGDDTTDEDLFRALPKEAYSIKVGLGNSSARYNVGTQQQALTILEHLLQAQIN